MSVRDRKLIIQEEEAKNVRLIFDLYVELGSTGDLASALDRRGIRTKQRTFSDGRVYGGKKFQRGALAHLLQNCIYIGKISHRSKAYPGEHRPIINRGIWDRVQSLLANNRRERHVAARAKYPSLLAGMITDGCRRPMSPSHATKGSRRYRYYVSRTEASDLQSPPWRLPAGPIEQLVIDSVSKILTGNSLMRLITDPTGDIASILTVRGNEMAKHLAETGPSDARATVLDLDLTVQISENQIALSIDCRSLFSQLLRRHPDKMLETLDCQDRMELIVPVTFKRRGSELKLVFRPDDANAPTQPDPKLIALIAKAFVARNVLTEVEESLAPNDRAHLTRLARLSYLAPDMIAAVVEGRQPADLTARRLLRAPDVPLNWSDQRTMFGFA